MTEYAYIRDEPERSGDDQWDPRYVDLAGVRMQDQAAERTLIGPPHAHLDAPCTDRCYETASAGADPAPTGDEPTPAVAGTFAIYPDGKGGYVLVTDVGGTVERRHIPAAVVKMVSGGGMFARKFAQVFGGGGS